MIANFHTHSTFSDGKQEAEDIVLAAIEKGFTVIGFSDHGYTDFDLRYCMKHTSDYIRRINQLKEQYQNQIQIYLGVEEDAFQPVANRSVYDYVIGSSHYICKEGKYCPIDSSYDYFSMCKDMFQGDVLAFAEAYYQNFCTYIRKRRPDIIGHFDLITKFDERCTPTFLQNDKYHKIAEKYLLDALQYGSIFEVNTGAISRGYRVTPYPAQNLLYLLKKNGGKVMLSSDSHCIETLDFSFKEVKEMLRDVGFQYVYTLYNYEFVKDYL